MSMEIVNGYVCRNCSDVELAKRGVDPAKPKDDPRSPAYDPAQAKADHGPAFKLSGALAKAGAVGSASDALPPVDAAAQTFAAASAPGARLNISA
ncbi:MAG TPA: hypothetical protein VG939_09730 [Caulobacteraceae bacterium]|nr:hypothetical protein [Caulobacteraceae bacterium]